MPGQCRHLGEEPGRFEGGPRLGGEGRVRGDTDEAELGDGARAPLPLGVAREPSMGVPVVCRSVFLDNDLSQNAIRFQVERLLGIARHGGSALGIGHPHRETLDVIKNYMHRLKTEVSVVPVSELIG